MCVTTYGESGRREAAAGLAIPSLERFGTGSREQLASFDRYPHSMASPDPELAMYNRPRLGIHSGQNSVTVKGVEADQSHSSAGRGHARGSQETSESALPL